jgi:hypothetical protein
MYAASLGDIPAGTVTRVVLSVSILGGAAMCFFGARLFRVALAIAGFVCGAPLAAAAALLFSYNLAITDVQTYPQALQVVAENPSPMLVSIALCGGVAGAILAALSERIGLFLVGVTLGGGLAQAVLIRANPGTYLTALAVVALIGGVLALLLRRAILILSTSLNGALALMFGVYAMLKQLSPVDAVLALQRLGNDAWVVFASAGVLGLIGLYVQFTSPTGSAASEASSGTSSKSKSKSRAGGKAKGRPEPEAA